MKPEDAHTREEPLRTGSRFAYWFAPVLLCLVSVVHVYQVEVRGRTPWIGGGFGMFASLESVGSRMVQITLETDRGNIAVAPPPNAWWDRFMALRVHPNAGTLRRYGEGLAALTWVLESPAFRDQSLQNLAVPIEEKSPESVRLETTPRLRVARPDDEAPIVEVHAIRLRVWQSRFELDEKRVHVDPRLDLRIEVTPR